MVAKAIAIGVGAAVVIGIGALILAQGDLPVENMFIPAINNASTTAPEQTTAEKNTAILDIKEQVPASSTVDLLADTYAIQPGSKKIVTIQVASSERARLIGTAQVTGDGSVWIYVADDGKEECPDSIWCGQDVIWGSSNFRYGTMGNEDNLPNNVRVNLVPGTQQNLIFENRGDVSQTITFDLDVVYSGSSIQ